MKYQKSSRFYELDNEEIPQNLLLPINCDYTTTQVLSNEVGRLDLVALRVYNNPTYWWFLARYNAILDPNLIYVGMSLKCPIIDKEKL